MPAVTVAIDDPPGHRAGSTPRRRGQVEALVLTLFAAAPVLATAARAAGTWRPVGDTAAITLRAADVFGRHSPLVGMPTTLSDTVGQTVHHPGPLEFWVIALGQVVSGHRAVPMMAVVAVNVTAIAAVVVLAGWLGGRNGRLLAALAVVACTWSLRGDYLVDPYNPYAAWLPLAAFAVALVCLLAGRWWALPVAIGFGSYAAQSHVSLLVPVTACVGAAGVAAVIELAGTRGGVAQALRSARQGLADHRTPLLVGAATAVVCSAPVVVDLVAGRHNLLVLARATSADGPTLGLSRAWQVVARALTDPPWLVPDRSPFETLTPVSGLRQLVALALVLGAAALAASLWRRRHVGTWIVAVAIAGLAGGMVAASRIPGGIFAAYALHNYLWLWVFTALFWAGAVVAVVASTATAAGTRSDLSVVVRRAPILAAVAIGAIALLGTISDPVRPSVLAGRHAPSVGSLGEQVAGELDPGHQVVVRIDAELDQSAVAMGLVRELAVRGFDARVDQELAGSFGAHRVVDDVLATRLVVVVGRTGPPEPPESSLELIAAYVPDARRATELAAANAVIEDRIRAAGGMTVAIEGGTLDPDAAATLVRTGDLVGLGRLGLVLEPQIPPEEFRRYADAQEGPILQVHVYRTPAGER